MIISAETIAAAQGTATKSGTGWLIRCPAHDDHSPSLSIKDTDNGRILVKCFAGCRQLDVIRALAAHGLWPHLVQLEKTIQVPTVVREPQTDDRKLQRILSLWKHSQPIQPGDSVDRYLKTRGISLATFPPALRYNSRLSYWLDEREIGKFPAMVARVEDQHLNLITVHRTYLTIDGTKANVPAPKKLMAAASAGAVRGGSIRLFKPTSVLGVAEGIETALACHLETGLPVWSTVSAGGMESLVVPDSIREVVIFADNDGNGAGQRAAHRLCERLLCEGRKVKIIVKVGESARGRKGSSTSPINRVFSLAEELSGLAKLSVNYGPLSSGKGLIYAVRDASEKQDKDGKSYDEGASDKRLYVLEGEFRGALRVLQREGNTLSAIVRTAYDHGDLSPLTKKDRIRATGTHIGIEGHITRKELTELLQSVDLFNGFSNRFLWTLVRRDKLLSRPTPMPADRVNDIATKLGEALKMARTVGCVQLSETAGQVWDEMYSSLTEDRPGVPGVVTSRAETYCLRLALIYSLLDKSREILPEHLAAALAVVQYSIDSAEYLFGTAEADPSENKIIAALNRRREMTQTQINELFSGHRSAEEITRVLTRLQAVGRIQQREERGAGRKTIHWSIRPGFSSPLVEE